MIRHMTYYDTSHDELNDTSRDELTCNVTMVTHLFPVVSLVSSVGVLPLLPMEVQSLSELSRQQFLVLVCEECELVLGEVVHVVPAHAPPPEVLAVGHAAAPVALHAAEGAGCCDVLCGSLFQGFVQEGGYLADSSHQVLL